MISIIIPVYKKEENLQKLIQYLRTASCEADKLEIIIVEAASENNNQKRISRESIVYVPSETHQRGTQMNMGVQESRGEILYFLHADSSPPLNFDEMIRESIHDDESNFGCFRMKFDSKNYILSFYSYFTRFYHGIFHGGDASLFVAKSSFNGINGYNEEMKLMEDYEIISQLKKSGNFKVIHQKVTTSARKYKSNGIIKLQWIYFIIQMMFRMNVSQDKILKFYKKNVK